MVTRVKLSAKQNTRKGKNVAENNICHIFCVFNFINIVSAKSNNIFIFRAIFSFHFYYFFTI